MISCEEFHKMIKKTKKRVNKYGNVKFQSNFVKYDSKGEYNRHLYLKDKEKDGVISNLRFQVEYLLKEGFKLENKKVRDIKYIADFVYNVGEKTYIEDFKGKETNVFKLKKKLLLNLIKYDFKTIFVINKITTADIWSQ